MIKEEELFSRLKARYLTKAEVSVPVAPKVLDFIVFGEIETERVPGSLRSIGCRIHSAQLGVDPSRHYSSSATQFRSN